MLQLDVPRTLHHHECLFVFDLAQKVVHLQDPPLAILHKYVHTFALEIGQLLIQHVMETIIRETSIDLRGSEKLVRMFHLFQIN